MDNVIYFLKIPLCLFCGKALCFTKNLDIAHVSPPNCFELRIVFYCCQTIHVLHQFRFTHFYVSYRVYGYTFYFFT